MPVTARFAPMLSTRAFQTSQSVRMAYKDDQDRESLKPKAHEYTQTGTDDEAAHSDAAFNPNKTSPENEKDTAGAGQTPAQNPLEGSPANKDMAKGGEGGEGKEKNKAQQGDIKRSGSGSGPKDGKVNPGDKN